MFRSANSVFANCLDVKNEVFEKKITFLVFVFCMLETEEQKKEKQTKWKRPRKPIKIGSFKVIIQKCEKSKNGFFSKRFD